MKHILWLTLLLSAIGSAREVPIHDFFKHAEFNEVDISPNGEYLAVTVPQDDRTLLAVLRTKDKSLVAKWDYGKNKHPYNVTWLNPERFSVYVAEKKGSFDYWIGDPDVYLANADGSHRMEIPYGGTYAFVGRVKEDPRRIFVQRTVERPNLFSMDIYTGRMTKLAASPVESGGFVIDHDGEIRYAIGVTDDFKYQTWRRNADGWKLVSEVDADAGDRQLPIAFAPDNKQVYLNVSIDGAPAGIALLEPETGKQTTLFNSKLVDVDEDGLIWSHDDKTLLGVQHEPDLPHKKYFDGDNAETQMMVALDRAFPKHAVKISSQTEDGRYAVAKVYSDTDPGRAYLFDMQTGKATFLLANMAWIKPEEMAEMKPVKITARDGLPLQGYLTVPKGSNGKNLPLIIHPHGGPHGPRDSWGFNPEIQFLANRGYAVLQVNYRGSGGYGQKFQTAGYQRWGTDMQNDLTDSLRWVVQQGIADPDRVCIYGASYGGYAALMSVVREPDLYKCTIGYVGVYSLPMMFTKGDIPDDKSGINFLNRVLPKSAAEQRAQSPAYNVDKIKTPMMLVQGRKDERVPIAHMDFLIDQMAKVDKKPEVVIIEDKEGHGFFDVENNVNLYNQMQAFLEKHIGKGAISGN